MELEDLNELFQIVSDHDLGGVTFSAGEEMTHAEENSQACTGNATHLAGRECQRMCLMQVFLQCFQQDVEERREILLVDLRQYLLVSQKYCDYEAASMIFASSGKLNMGRFA